MPQGSDQAAEDVENEMAKVFYTEMSRTSYEWTEMVPGTTQRETVYGTTVIEAQDWSDVPENGIYWDRTYRITTCYRANRPGALGQLVGHCSDERSGMTDNTQEWNDLREQPAGIRLVVDDEGDRWALDDDGLWYCLAGDGVAPRHWHRLVLEYGPLHPPRTSSDSVWWAIYNAAIAEGLDSYDAEQVADNA